MAERAMAVTGNDLIFNKLTQRLVRRFALDRRGNIAPLVALLIVPLVGLMGVATEGGGWFLIQRAAQNAADSAVIAAATNGSNGGTDYATEAKSITSSYGFNDGTNNVTVTVPSPTRYASVTSCASSPCYRVTVTKAVPLNLLRIVGYSGNTTVNGGAGQIIAATALATAEVVNGPACLLALGSGDAVDGSGLNHSTIGCNIMSNGNSPYCNGTNGLTDGWSDSAGSPQNAQHSCSSDPSHQAGGLSPYPDPYQGVLTANPPTNPCSNYYPSSNANFPGGNKIQGTPGWDGSEKVFCGDVQLSGNVTLSGASTVLVIENGTLNLNNYTLSTASGAGLTIVFTSPNPTSESYTSGGTPSNFVIGGGTNGILDIAAPTSGTWSGIAMIQNAQLPVQSVTYTGNNPTFKISGVIDAPALDLTAKGAVNKSTNGYSCFTLVVNTLQINGTGDLFYVNAQLQCAQAGVNTIEVPAAFLGKLVY
jgi:Flp pilus assembly protein TadG